MIYYYFYFYFKLMDTSNIEDYDEIMEALIKRINKNFKGFRSASDADSMNVLSTIRKAIKEMKQTGIYYKRELALIPKANEEEFKAKYQEYLEKIEQFEF